MDFSAIPFRSALERLGQMLPIDVLTRLGTVESVFLAQSYPNQHFGFVEIGRRECDGRIYVRKEKNSPPLSVHTVYDADAVLNDGTVACSSLLLRHTQDIPAECIACSRGLLTSVIDRAFLSFLKNPVTRVTADLNTPPQTDVTLAEFVALIGPTIGRLQLPLTAFPDGDDLTQLTFKRRREPLFVFCANLASVPHCLSWLQTNVAFLARGTFTTVVVIEVSGAVDPCPEAEQLAVQTLSSHYPLQEHPGCEALSFIVNTPDWSVKRYRRDPRCHCIC